MKTDVCTCTDEEMDARPVDVCPGHDAAHVILEFSSDGGATWHHGRYLEAWVTEDRAALAAQRAVVREFARRDWVHANAARIVTRVLAEDDPRAAINREVTA